jgi:hypothetical protein
MSYIQREILAAPMPIRTDQDTCLLCQIRKSTKRNSHIFPKFWVKSILGSDSKKEGYTVSSAAEKLGQKIQDSPKEDFIFCPECEARFGFLERYVANSFYNIYKDSAYSSDFPIVINAGDELNIMSAINVSPFLFKLFIYSLVWRASISNRPVFTNFKLKQNDEEQLRKIINTYLQSNEADTISFFSGNGNGFKSLPFNLITTLEPADSTSNMIAPFDTEDGRILLFANEFMIIVYLDWNAPNSGSKSYNMGSQQVCISIVDLGEWQRLHGIIVNMLVGHRLENFNG